MYNYKVIWKERNRTSSLEDVSTSDDAQQSSTTPNVYTRVKGGTRSFYLFHNALIWLPIVFHQSEQYNKE